MNKRARPSASVRAPNFKSLSPAIWRASTVVFDSAESFAHRRENLYDGFTYGTTGTPTSRELEARIAALEGADFCVVVPSGQAALCLVVMTLVRAGDHLLIPDSAYGPLKTFAREWVANFGVEVSFYPPAIGDDIEQLITPRTRLITMESPGSITMEVQDVAAIAQTARRAGIVTAVDNTWATPLGFKPIAHGADISVEAASKQFGGHSDVLLGSISTSSRVLYEKLRRAQSVMGLPVSPDDCFLVLRGLETLALRVNAQGDAAEKVANWLLNQAEVRTIFYPPVPASPGHELFEKYFDANGCVMSFALSNTTPQQGIDAFFDALEVFAIGASWGGVHSLAGFYPAVEQASRVHPATTDNIVRLSIGLEGAEAQIQDLERAFGALRTALGN
jgi:cysteine-S-conjugate beta-lyase